MPAEKMRLRIGNGVIDMSNFKKFLFCRQLPDSMQFYEIRACSLKRARIISRSKFDSLYYFPGFYSMPIREQSSFVRTFKVEPVVVYVLDCGDLKPVCVNFGLRRFYIDES